MDNAANNIAKKLRAAARRAVDLKVSAYDGRRATRLAGPRKKPQHGFDLTAALAEYDD